MTKSKKILITSLLIIILITIICFVYLSKKSAQVNTNKIAKEPIVDDISRASEKKIESLVKNEYQLPLVMSNKEKNIFVIKYVKKINDIWTNYVAIAVEKKSEENFHLVLDMKVPIDMYGRFSYTQTGFVDFNNDGLEDIYVGVYLDQRSKENNGFVLLQKKPGEFLLASKESKNLFRYLGDGIPEFLDVDNDGKPEILITEDVVFNSTTEKYKVTSKIIKLKGDKFYLQKTKWIEYI
jgi:hypothetical protein